MPQSATRCRTTMGNMGRESEGANTMFAPLTQRAARTPPVNGQQGKCRFLPDSYLAQNDSISPISIGFCAPNRVPPFPPKGFPSALCENILYLIAPTNNHPHDKSLIFSFQTIGNFFDKPKTPYISTQLIYGVFSYV